MLTKPFNEQKLWKGKMSYASPSKLSITFAGRTTENTSYRLSPLQHSELDKYQIFSDKYWAGVRIRNKLYREKMQNTK